MELRQNLKMSQTLVMTPQLQQAIRLLQLSRLELLEQVRQEVEQNPLLEGPDEPTESELTAEAPGERSLEAANQEAAAQLDAPESTTTLEVQTGVPDEVNWDCFLNSYAASEPPRMSGNGVPDELPPLDATLTRPEGLAEHLDSQLAGANFNDAEHRIKELILGNLDRNGYLRLPDSEGDPLIALAAEVDVPMAVAEKVLRTIQQLDPLGCGARDLVECLLIQLHQCSDRPEAPLLACILKRSMKELQSKNYALLAKEHSASHEEVGKAVRLLASLNPFPGRNFGGDEATYITPDVFVYKLEGGYSVVLNDDGLSRLRISETYRKALRDGTLKGSQTREFVQERLRSALWFIRSIHQRQRTIVKVTESIVRFQKEFLDKGVSYLKPLILRDVAEDIGMHESTVSRVTSGKYVHTPQGIYELKFFFNSSISTTYGDDVSSEAVKQALRQLIAAEDPKKPVSDQKLVGLLKTKGIRIARRTVAKYREELGVASSNKRKQVF